MTNTALAQYVCLIGFSVSPDSRIAVLARAGARGETVDADGTIHGDTTGSYYDYAASMVGQAKWNWQQFNATLVGGWHYKPNEPLAPILDISYQWNPAYSGATRYWNQWSQRFGQQDYTGISWKGVSGSPTAETLTYTATDNVDGAKAEAAYVLTRHDHLEEKQPAYFNHGVRGTKHRLGNKTQYNRTSAAVQTAATYTEDAFTFTVGVDIGIDFDVTKWKLASVNVGTNFSYSYTINTGAEVPAITLPPGYCTYAMVYDTYDRRWGQVDQRDEGGYVGIKNYDGKVPAGYELIFREPVPISGEGSGAF